MASFRKYQTKHGQRWLVTVSYTDKFGKYRQINKGGFKLKKEATQVALQLESDLQKRDYFAQSQLTFNQVYQKWLKIKADLKPSSQQNIRSVIKNHILPTFGDMIISKITVNDCQEAVEQWYFHPYKKYYRFFLLLNSVLGFAVERNYIYSNPASAVHLPRADRQPVKTTAKKQFYTASELRDVLRAMRSKAPQKMFTFFWLLANTGLRRGEMIGLQWGDIDFEKHTLTVNRTQTYGIDNKSILNSPKTKLSQRTVYLANITCDYLKSWQITQSKLLLENGKSGILSKMPVFNRLSDFNMMSTNYPSAWLKRFCEQNKLPYLEIKGWRHTFATLGVENNNLTTKQIQAELGHATANMTLNVYAGISNEEKARTADTMAKLVDFNS